MSVRRLIPAGLFALLAAHQPSLALDVDVGIGGASVGGSVDVGGGGVSVGVDAGAGGAGGSVGASVGGDGIGANVETAISGDSGGGSPTGGGGTTGGGGRAGEHSESSGAGAAQAARSSSSGTAPSAALPAPTPTAPYAVRLPIWLAPEPGGDRPAAAGSIDVTGSLRLVGMGPLIGRAGTPPAVVQACRTALGSAAAPYRPLRVEVVSAGRSTATRGGGMSAPVRARIVYSRGGQLDIKEAQVTCRLNRAGEVVGAG